MHQLLQAAEPPGDAGRTVAVPHDELGQERIVVRGDYVALVEVRIDPHPGPAGQDQSLDTAAPRQEAPRPGPPR